MIDIKKIAKASVLLAVILIAAGLAAFLFKIKIAFAVFGIATVCETTLLTALIGLILFEVIVSVPEGCYMQGIKK